jgi:hypothetical protein
MLPFVCGGVFVYNGWLGVKYDSQATNRKAAGGEGGSHRESSLLPVGRPRVKYDSQPRGYVFFV